MSTKDGGMNVVERMIREPQSEPGKVLHKQRKIEWEFPREKIPHAEGEEMV